VAQKADVPSPGRATPTSHWTFSVGEWNHRVAVLVADAGAAVATTVAARRAHLTMGEV
jgi:hypothetical protein